MRAGSLSWSAESSQRLDRAFFARPTVEVAVALLGCVLTTRIRDGETSGRIVEVEAYGDASDPASHAARLRRGRVESMSGPPGIVYVYRSYGIHPMLNVVAEPDGIAGAVLIRALEPLAGQELMRRRRGVEETGRLCCGPGCLTVAMGITLDDHGRDIVSEPGMSIELGMRPKAVSAGPRIGI
ncbi:MAG: DNA-3-methyladenine glycosylase [Thermomicrobiales bacterium]